jgi:hypothetical protein
MSGPYRIKTNIAFKIRIHHSPQKDKNTSRPNSKWRRLSIYRTQRVALVKCPINSTMSACRTSYRRFIRANYEGTLMVRLIRSQSELWHTISKKNCGIRAALPLCRSWNHECTFETQDFFLEIVQFIFTSKMRETGNLLPIQGGFEWLK